MTERDEGLKDEGLTPVAAAGAPQASEAEVTSHPGVQVAVHNGHCHHYGVCVQEAPGVFALRSATRLRYVQSPEPSQTAAVRQAARLCPMQAITVDLA